MLRGISASFCSRGLTHGAHNIRSSIRTCYQFKGFGTTTDKKGNGNPTIYPVSPPPVSPKLTFDLQTRITVVGVGGAGGNAVNHMITSHLEGVDFVVCNTDSQALTQSLCTKKIHLGARSTAGLGAGAKVEVGKTAAEESMDQVIDMLKDCHMVFLAAGMGGGTGTGATPVIAKTLKTLQPDILTVAVVTKPFKFEGRRCAQVALAGLEELSKHVDALVVISNEKMISVAGSAKFEEAFQIADRTLHAGVRTISDLMVVPGLINLDFSDVKSILSGMRGSIAMMGVGEASGDGRALKAAKEAVLTPLLDNETTLQGAKGILINITAGKDLGLHEVDDAASFITAEADPEADIKVGHCLDHEMNGRVRVSVVCAKPNIK